MSKPVMFIAHDPVSNTEMQVSEFDPALLKAAAAQGVVFIAVDANGFREIVQPEDVTPPDGICGSFTLVEPVYVDARMNAVIDVFDALEAVLCSEVETMAEQAETTARKAPARKQQTPADVFRAKLAALKEIAAPGGES